MKIIFLLIILIGPSLGSGDNASDREYLKENDPKISTALGIGTLQFEDCFYKNNADSQHDTQNMLLTCLRQYNPNITYDQLNSVLDQYRPER